MTLDSKCEFPKGVSVLTLVKFVSLGKVSPQNSPLARLRMSVTTDRMDGFDVYFLVEETGVSRVNYVTHFLN